MKDLQLYDILVVLAVPDISVFLVTRSFCSGFFSR